MCGIRFRRIERETLEYDIYTRFVGFKMRNPRVVPSVRRNVSNFYFICFEISKLRYYVRSCPRFSTRQITTEVVGCSKKILFNRQF